jgi:hypothetical protein
MICSITTVSYRCGNRLAILSIQSAELTPKERFEDLCVTTPDLVEALPPTLQICFHELTPMKYSRKGVMLAFRESRLKTKRPLVACLKNLIICGEPFDCVPKTRTMTSQIRMSVLAS